MTRGPRVLTACLAVLAWIAACPALWGQHPQFQEPRVEYTLDYSGLDLPTLEELLPRHAPYDEAPTFRLAAHQPQGPAFPNLPVAQPIPAELPPPAGEVLPPATPTDPPSKDEPISPDDPVDEVFRAECGTEVAACEEILIIPEYGVLGMIPYGEYIHMDYWFGEATWKNSFELGINGQTGNTESLSLRGGARLRRDGKYTNATANIRHLRTSNRGTRTQNNAIMDSRLEIPFQNLERWHLFETTFLEYDEFRVFDLRLAVNAGVGYKLVKDDRTDWTVSVGSGISREYGGPNQNIVPEGMLGTSLIHQMTKRHSIEGKFEIFPDWGDFSEFRHVGEFAYKVMLDEKDQLSMKFSIVNRYDSTSSGGNPNDLDYAVLLLFKN